MAKPRAPIPLLLLLLLPLLPMLPLLALVKGVCAWATIGLLLVGSGRSWWSVFRWSLELYSRNSVVEGTASAFRADTSIRERSASSVSKHLVSIATRSFSFASSVLKRSRSLSTTLSMSNAFRCREMTSILCDKSSCDGGKFEEEADRLHAPPRFLLLPPPRVPPTR